MRLTTLAFAMATLLACGDDAPAGPNLDAPNILDFTSDVAQLTAGGSVTFRAFVGDRNGDLLGGTLKDVGGVSYGTFVGPGDDGAFAITLTWEQMQSAVSIDFESAAQRVFRAEFLDQVGNRGTAEVSIALTCGGVSACQGQCGKTACGAACVTLEDDDANCGACGVQCLPGTCRQRVCSCETDQNCPGSSQCFPDPTESPASQCQIVGQTRLVSDDGTAGARAGVVEIELDGAWVPVCDANDPTGDVGTLVCRKLFSATGEAVLEAREARKGLVLTCDQDADDLRYCDASIPDGGCTSQLRITCGDTCTPACDGLECGSDGCGGNCGECNGEACIDGYCGGCDPQCGNRRCGSDGCGGSCGSCPGGTTCDEDDGRCYAPPVIHIHDSGELGELEYARYSLVLYDGYDIKIKMTSEGNDASLYVRVDVPPDSDHYDAWAFPQFEDAELDFTMPRAGTLHIAIGSIFGGAFTIDTFDDN